MNGVDSRLLGYVLKKLAALYGNRDVSQEWFNLLVRHLAEIEHGYRECKESKKGEAEGEEVQG